MHYIKVAEHFYSRLYASDVRPKKTTKRTSLASDVPLITEQEVENAFKGMKSGKSAGDVGVTVDLSRKAGYIVLKKLTDPFSKCIKTLKVPLARKNANIILILVFCFNGILIYRFTIVF